MLNNHLYTFSELIEKGVLVPLEEENIRQQSNQDELNFKNLNGVVVPMIQRPYAQGRRSEYETKVRENFLADLFSVIDNKNESLELNFVYGVHTKEDNLELLDGQQRLTTLFLLYWYALNTSEVTDIKLLNNLKKFTYQTRTTSTQFIEKLLKDKITLKLNPSKEIMKKPWYTTAFSKDSTVTGMLTMLDAIHNIVSKKENPKLTIKDLERLKFYLLELENFGRADDLFIKMNARGLQLTPFENFKAELVGWIKDPEKWGTKYNDEIIDSNNKIPFWLSFSSNLDGRWVDLFWKLPRDEFGNPVIDSENLGASFSDNQFFTFIKRWLANRSLTMNATAPANSETSFFYYFSSKSDDNFYHSFEEYEKLITQGFNNNLDLIRELYKTLQFLRHEKIGSIIMEGLCPPWLKGNPKEKENYLPWIPQIEMRPMIIFSSVIDFILSQPDSPEEFDVIEFNHWMRLVHNIVQNRDVNSAAIQIILTRQLHRIINHGLNDEVSTLIFADTPESNELRSKKLRAPIYERFVDYVDNLDGNLLSRELIAEKDKILLIFNDEKWESAFIEAEKDPYMTGSVSFYIDEQTDIPTFIKRTTKVPFIFDEKGIVSELREEYSLIRAILAKSYDFSKFKLPGYHFQICNQNMGNRFLKNMTIWNDNPQVKEFFCSLLDIDEQDEMKRFIENTSKESNPIIPNESFDSEINTMLQKGFNRLIESEPSNALSWLQGTGEKAMGVYFYKNGEIALYKGSVNSMFLNSFREEFLSSLFQILRDTDFEYEFIVDKRPLYNYEKYGLYSGERPLYLKIKNSKTEFLMMIYSNITCKIFFTNKDLAYTIINTTNEVVSDTENSLYFEDLKLNHEDLQIEIVDNNPYYMGIQILDIRNDATVSIAIDVVNKALQET